MYVEQRYFGTSNSGQGIKELADLDYLIMDNVINDNVELIKYLSLELHTNNFLVFGGGHGGLIAGYLAYRFVDDENLKSKYNVLGWSSSPPIKYLRQGNKFTRGGEDFQELNRQVALLLKTGGGFEEEDMRRLTTLFRLIRGGLID